MSANRPDPDALLAHMAVAEPERRRGRLKVFFGATAGVGKTYAMLESARVRKHDGVDLVAGVVETHGRPETARLLEGLEILPRRVESYRGVELTELDLDAALARHPELVLVDELAHTNAPGSRHAKRWEDVEELLAAGLDVFTTVNVQHLESLNDVVAQITHVKVRETVPDALLDAADEIELIDLPTEQLLKRLQEGKVYIPEQARRAERGFFRPGNLIALRQLALHATAKRVDAQMNVYRRAHGVEDTWPVSDRILVGVGPAPSSERLVRTAKRMADKSGASWIAMFVETPASARWSEADRHRVWETLRLAERLGATPVTLSGVDRAAELLAYARANNVTRLVVGKPTRSRWRDALFGSLVEEIIRQSGDIDVHVTTGEPGHSARAATRRWPGAAVRPPGGDHLRAVAWVAAATLVALLTRPYFDPGNLMMTYLLVIVLVALRLGRGPSVLASVLGVAAFDFFCVPPYYTFGVADSQYVVAFAAMLVVALVISSLTARTRDQARLSRNRERRTAALLAMSRDLVSTVDREEILAAGTRHLEEVFRAGFAVLLADRGGRLEAWQGRPTVVAPSDVERAVAQWSFDHGRPAGAGTDTLPSSAMLYLPLRAAQESVGILGVREGNPLRFADPEELHFLEAFASQMGASVQRARLAEDVLRAGRLEEMSRLRREFVAVASHELRTPLDAAADHIDALRSRGPGDTAVVGAQGLGATADAAGPGAAAHLDAAAAELTRLRSLVDELLDLSQMEAGRARLALSSLAPRELVEDALAAVRVAAEGRDVRFATEVSPGLAEVRADPGRVSRVMEILLSNAILLAGTGGHVLVSADQVGPFVQFSVANDGPGIPPYEQSRIFDQFVSIPRGDGSQGASPGLAIAREIVRSHGGAIWVDSGPGPGSVFSFTLPVET